MLGVKFKRVTIHRQHCTLGTVPANELNQLARAGTISNCFACLSPRRHPAVALPSPCPPFARHRHHPDRRCPLTRTGTATVIAIGVMVAAIPIRAAATTDAILPAANSTTAVPAHCRRCRVGGPVGGAVVDDDAVAADAPEAPPLPPSGVMDPTAAGTTKTCDGTASAVATVTAAAMEEEEYNDGRAPTPNAPPPPGRWDSPLLDRRDDGGRGGGGSIGESGNPNNVNARNQCWCVVHWVGGVGG